MNDEGSFSEPKNSDNHTSTDDELSHRLNEIMREIMNVQTVSKKRIEVIRQDAFRFDIAKIVRAQKVNGNKKQEESQQRKVRE